MTSKRKLPDDFARWPKDAYQLLGVDRDADIRTVKRAYAQLIRQYKPEHHPAEFARIRAAYEEIQRRLAWLSEMQEDVEDSPPPISTRIEVPDLSHLPIAEEVPADELDVQDLADLEELAADDRSPPHSAPRTRRTQEQFEQSVEAAWQIGCRGNLAEAYRQLSELNQQVPGNEEVCMRLYWLLRLQPSLDASRHATHSLVDFMRRHRLGGRAWHLYRTELKRTPELVTTPDNDSLARLHLSRERTLDFFEARWSAAVTTSNWGLIRGDLKALRERFLTEDGTTWARMLFRMFELVAWSPVPPAQQLLKFARRSLNELAELHLPLREEFERHDVLYDMAKSPDFTKLHKGAAVLIDLIRQIPLESPDLLRRKMQVILEGWSDAPRWTLRVLDDILRLNPIAFQQLHNFVRGISPSPPPFVSQLSGAWSTVVPDQRLTKHHMSQATEWFFYDRIALPYDKLRVELVLFCLREHITLEEVLVLMKDGLSTERWKQLMEVIEADSPLALLITGVKGFWLE